MQGGLSMEEGRRRTEDGRRRTEDGRRRTEDGRRRTEDERRRTEGGGKLQEVQIKIKFHLPKCIYRLGIRSALLYRKLRYGYTFRRIPLTQGKYAIVDVEDYDRIAKYKWYAAKCDRRFYGQRKVVLKNGKCGTYTIRMQRLILKPQQGKIIDHINHNGLDNRKANLRFVTPLQNSWNARKQSGKHTSKYKGVHFHKRNRRWQTKIRCKGKEIYLGNFKDEQAAARAYDEKAKELFGQYAALNFPE